jgi:hypothetical protein
MLHKSDQFGRIFADWAIFLITEVAHIFGHFFTEKSSVWFFNGFGYILGNFLQNILVSMS